MKSFCLPGASALTGFENCRGKLSSAGVASEILVEKKAILFLHCLSLPRGGLDQEDRDLRVLLPSLSRITKLVQLIVRIP